MAKNLGKWKAHVLKKLPIMVICALIAGLAYAWLIRHYRNFSMDKQDLLYRIESKIFDLKIVMRGPQKPTGKVGILALDENTLKVFGTWPISRRYYAQAYENLKKLGVKWIGYDAVYSEREKSTLEDASDQVKRLAGNTDKKAIQGIIGELDEMREVSPAEQSFLAGMQSFENIVMGYFYFGTEKEAVANLGNRPRFEGLETMLTSEIQGIDMPEGKTLNDYLVKKPEGLTANMPFLSQATPHFAFFNNDGDDDAINRWLTLVVNMNGHLMPSLALKTVSEYLNREPFVFFNGTGIESIELVNREDESDSLRIPIDSNGVGRILINHRGGGRGFHHFSLADAYNNSFSEKEKKMLKGMVLLLGATATGINDSRPNPFDAAIDGVENHAAGMDNIIRGDFYKRPSSIFTMERSIVIGVGILFTLMLMYSSAVVSGLSLVIFLGALFYIDKVFWFGKGIWTFTAIPCIEISLMFTGITLFKYITEEKEKKKVKGAFQHYLSPEVIDQVLENPDQLKLGGQRKELTVFFSDVRGFTTISETLTPEKLSELMNEYFTPMTGIVLRSKGVLDKYIGDAIMAFWGAPMEVENHADNAALASIEMLYALDKLRAEFKAKGLPDIDIGIGLNTGPMSVGNMGSGERFTYTVMGDSVNLGSRLEGLTKEYGIKIMISEFTYAKLSKGKFFTRDLDDIRVKGKNEPVKVYHLMRPDFFPDKKQIHDFVAHFEVGRKHYKTQDWAKAQEAFHQCLQMKPDDKATAMYLERIEHYIEESPGSTWDGVYTFKHK